MTMLIAVMALAAGAPAAPAATVNQHAQHQQQHQGQKHQSNECCCKDMAQAGEKMPCCAEHGKGNGGAHSGHHRGQ